MFKKQGKYKNNTMRSNSSLRRILWKVRINYSNNIKHL